MVVIQLHGRTRGRGLYFRFSFFYRRRFWLSQFLFPRNLRLPVRVPTGFLSEGMMQSKIDRSLQNLQQFNQFLFLFFSQNLLSTRGFRHLHRGGNRRRTGETCCGHLLCEQVLFVRFYNNPATVIRSMQFHYCTVSNPGTGADDAFVLKRRGV